jgi:hypothetical protein
MWRRSILELTELSYSLNVIMLSVPDVTNSIWTKNSSLIRLPDTDTNLTTPMSAVIKESDFIYGKEKCLVLIWRLVLYRLPSVGTVYGWRLVLYRLPSVGTVYGETSLRGTMR